jgi:hypothetical protein
VFGLGIDDALFSPERKPNGKQRSVADHVLQLPNASWRRAAEGPRRQQRINEC